MMNSLNIRPPNSIVFICDPVFLSDLSRGTIPVLESGSALAATESRISIACASEQDLPTEITFGPARDVAPEGAPIFDAQLETPSRTVNLATVDQDAVVSSSVTEARTRVRIWVNHPKEPDKVVVCIG